MSKIRTKRTNVTREWVRLVVPKGATALLTQAIMETKVDEVVAKMNQVGAWCRVEHHNQHANVHGSNGQKVKVSIV